MNLRAVALYACTLALIVVVLAGVGAVLSSFGFPSGILASPAFRLGGMVGLIAVVVGWAYGGFSSPSVLPGSAPPADGPQA